MFKTIPQMHDSASGDRFSYYGVDLVAELDETEDRFLQSTRAKRGKNATITVKAADSMTLPSDGQVTVRSLTELDALTGGHVAKVDPIVHWEESGARFRFESLSEALEAMRDPMIQGCISPQKLASTVIEEVHEFPPYSTDFSTAWRLIDKLIHLPFQLDRKEDDWTARFGEAEPSTSSSAPVAICLAALKTQGLSVKLRLSAEADC